MEVSFGETSDLSANNESLDNLPVSKVPTHFETPGVTGPLDISQAFNCYPGIYGYNPMVLFI